MPRYPTNVYYNAATVAQQLDEYNWLYNASKGCVPVPDVTTCNSADVTWQTYVNNEATTMFTHVMGNDPRPHYFHQTNLANYDSGGGVLYPVVDELLSRYDAAFDRSSAPLVQLTATQIGDELARQAAWQADVKAGHVSGYLQDGQVHVSTTATISVPLTGTTVGDLYGGQRSGWTTVAAGPDAVFAPSDPANATAPVISGSIQRVGETLTATAGTWTGTAPVSFAYQWQRCDATGTICSDIATATAATYQTQALDKGQRLRVVVSAANWISAVSQARSALTDPVAMPSIQVTNHVVAADGVAETGRFDLTVDDAVKANDVGDGGTTGPLIVGVGDHTVAEMAGTGTSLSDYASDVECRNGANPPLPLAHGTSLKLTVALGDQWKCTVTEHPQAGDRGADAHTRWEPARLDARREHAGRRWDERSRLAGDADVAAHRAQARRPVRSPSRCPGDLERERQGDRDADAPARRDRPPGRQRLPEGHKGQPVTPVVPAVRRAGRHRAAGGGRRRQPEARQQLRRQAPAAGRLPAGGHGCRRCDGAALCGSHGDVHRREAIGLSPVSRFGAPRKGAPNRARKPRTRTRTQNVWRNRICGPQACQGTAADRPRATRVPGV